MVPFTRSARRGRGQRRPADGFSPPYIAAVAYGSACYGFLAVLLSAQIARRVIGRGLGASLAVAAGTPLLFYAYIAPGFGHAASAFAVSLFVWVWIRVRPRWSPTGAIALGVCAGLMGIVREQDLLLAAGPAVDFLIFWAGSRREAARREPLWTSALVGVVSFAAALTPLLFAYTALNGHPGATRAATKMTWTAPHALAARESQFGFSRGPRSPYSHCRPHRVVAARARRAR
jgi:hypothetical protein